MGFTQLGKSLSLAALLASTQACVASTADFDEPPAGSAGTEAQAAVKFEYIADPHLTPTKLYWVRPNGEVEKPLRQPAAPKRGRQRTKLIGIEGLTPMVAGDNADNVPIALYEDPTKHAYAKLFTTDAALRDWLQKVRVGETFALAVYVGEAYSPRYWFRAVQ